MRRIITPSLRNSVYNALVNSNLSYAISVWGSGANESKLRPLFIIQKRCLRNLYKVRKESKLVKGHTKTTFNAQNILTVYNLYYYFTLSCIARIRKIENPEYLYSLLNIDNNKQRMVIPLLKTEHYQLNFMFQGPKLWNQMLPYIKDKHFNLPWNMNLFKTRVKSFLLKLQSYSDENNWTIANRCIDTFIALLKCDPYVSTVELIPQVDTKINNINNKTINLPFIQCDPLPCNFCNLINLPPFFQGPPVLETVNHVLTECPLYHNLRSNLSVSLKCLIIRTEYNKIKTASNDLSYEFELFTKKCTELRNNYLNSGTFK